MGDDNSFTSSPPTSKYIPSYIDGTPIVHDNNRGSIAGTIHEFDLWKLRTGVFIEYSELHGVVYKSHIAVECATAAIFYINPEGDPRSARNPAPPALDRLAELNERRAAMTPPRNAIAPLAAVPAEVATTIIVAPHLVREESSRYMQALLHVFGKSTTLGMDGIVLRAAGNGYRLRTLLLAEGERADPGDKSVIRTTFQSLTLYVGLSERKL